MGEPSIYGETVTSPVGGLMERLAESSLVDLDTLRAEKGEEEYGRGLANLFHMCVVLFSCVNQEADKDHPWNPVSDAWKFHAQKVLIRILPRLLELPHSPDMAKGFRDYKPADETDAAVLNGSQAVTE